jgi:glutathione S-transferase
MTERLLYQFTLSPYCIKIRRILEYKRLAYRTVEINPFNRRPVVSVSGQKRVPVLVESDGLGARKVVHDSTAIARYLDEICPDPPVYPRDPAESARVAILEDWADEVFSRNLVAFKFTQPANPGKAVELSKPFYPPKPIYKMLFPLGPLYLRREGKARAGGRAPAVVKADFESDLDRLEALASRSKFLAGETPTVFDFAVWGFLRTMEGLDGEELLRLRPALAGWYAAVAGL